MKRIISIISLAFVALLFSCTETTEQVDDTVKNTTDQIEKVIDEHAGHDHSGHDHSGHDHADHKELKDHVCSATCKETGKCVAACGEKGHECKEACHVDHKELKDHVCTEACKEAGKCVIVCGEKGHECTTDCKGHADSKHECSSKCNTGTHTCGEQCGCGDGCVCTAEKSCSEQCNIKKS